VGLQGRGEISLEGPAHRGLGLPFVERALETGVGFLLRFSPFAIFRTDNKIVRLLASVKLTVVLLIAVGLACILGTLIPQADAIGGSPQRIYAIYVSRYGPRLHRLFNALSFYRVYSSWWFSALLLGLVANMLVCTLRRWRRRWNQVGFQLTHLSIIFLLAGVLVGLHGREGMMRIYEGEASDTILLDWKPRVASTFEQAKRLARELADEGGGARLRLGFSIHLDDFEVRREREPLDLLRVQSVRGGPVRSYNIAFQKRIARAAGELFDIEVLETAPAIRKVSRVVEGRSGRGDPAAEFEITAGGRRQTFWIFSTPPHNRLILTDEGEIEYRRCRSVEEMNRLLAAENVPTVLSTDTIRVAVGSRAPLALPLRLGLVQRIEGSSATVEALRFLPDWKMNPKTREVFSASGERRNPAVLVRVAAGGRAVEQWLFSRFPDFARPVDLGGTPMTLQFDEAEQRRRHFVRVLDCNGAAEHYLQHYVGGRLVETVEAGEGRALSLPGGIELRPLRWLENAEIETAEEEDPNNFEALLLLRDRSTGRTERLRVRSGRLVSRGPLRFALEREYPIAQFVSHVRVIDNGRVVLKKDIQMNDPLRYRGYVFYQASYDAEAGDASPYTILSVKSDPGVWFVYAGFAMMTLGLVIVFYINPLFGKRRREVDR